jgi:4'-phosphopantetheinyl transferase
MGQGQPADATLVALRADPADWLLLTADERQRADRYALDRIRTQFVAVRAALRRRLGERLGLDPIDVPIAVRPDGKPIVVGHSVFFNVAHSGDHGLIAVSDHDVGVDLERIRDVPNAADLLHRFFAPNETRQYESLPADLKAAGFFRGWTCKEAVLKGDGRAMRIVDRCEVCFDPRLPPRLIARADGMAEWDLATWSPAPGTVAAIARKVMA